MILQKNISFLASINSEIENSTISSLSFEKGSELLNSISESTGYSIDTLYNVDIELKQKAKSSDIKLLALDVDGVMTDGGMYYTEAGDEFKKYNTKDGMAIKKLTANGFHVCILSSGFNKNLIKRRAELLEIEKVFVGRGRKIEIIKGWCEEYNITMQNVAYIGDDINDLEIIKEAGFSACPNDAIQLIKNEVHVILDKKGGKGCIREFIDTYIKETK